MRALALSDLKDGDQNTFVLSAKQKAIIDETKRVIELLKTDTTLHGGFVQNPVKFLSEHGVPLHHLSAPLQQELQMHLSDVSLTSKSLGCWACEIGLVTAVVVIGGVVVLLAAVLTGGIAAIAALAAATTTLMTMISVVVVTSAVTALSTSGVTLGITLFSMYVAKICEAANACTPGKDHDLELGQWVGLEVITAGTTTVQSATAISTTIIDTTVYSAVFNSAGLLLYACELGATSSDWQQIPLPTSAATNFCLANDGTNLYVLFNGAVGLVCMSTATPTILNSWVEDVVSVEGEIVGFAARPAAALLNGVLYVAGLSVLTPNAVCLISYSGGEWSGNSLIVDRKNHQIASATDVALCAYGDDLYCVYPGIGGEGNLRFIYASGSVKSWSEEAHVTVHGSKPSTKIGLASAAFANKMYVFYVDGSNAVKWLTWNGEKWRGKTTVVIASYDPETNKNNKQQLHTLKGIACGSMEFPDAKSVYQDRLFAMYVSNTEEHSGDAVWSVS